MARDPDEGGAFVNPSFGVKFFVSRNTALQLAVGFRYQQGVVTQDYYDWNGNVNARKYVHHEMNSATLKFGVAF